MDLWLRRWRVNVRTGKIKSYLVDINNKRVNDPERLAEIADQEFIKTGFESEGKAKRFYAKHKNYYLKRISNDQPAGA